MVKGTEEGTSRSGIGYVLPERRVHCTPESLHELPVESYREFPAWKLLSRGTLPLKESKTYKVLFHTGTMYSCIPRVVTEVW